jgi:nitrogenase molybdenum-iron protein NifN
MTKNAKQQEINSINNYDLIMESIKAPASSFVSTRNACKLCAPLGASVVFKGIKGCIPMIHGSQGCSTYIRRYLISHYKEPVDIASSNFSEETTIFGGNKNFIAGIDNIIKQYKPDVIGIASACLSETIGENIPGLIHEYQVVNNDKPLPIFIHASTPSYNGTHVDGFHEAVTETIAAFAQNDKKSNNINIFPGFVSPEDIRHLKNILEDFGLDYTLFPDYSDTLDNPHWKEYQLIPEGGTSPDDLQRTGSARVTLEFGYVLNKGRMVGRLKNSTAKFTAGQWLENKFDVPCQSLGMPIGINETDRFFNILEVISGQKVPEHHQRERGRLVDAYVDGHKYLFGKRAIVYGEEDLVIGIVSFLEEIGIETILVASGGESGILQDEISRITNGKRKNMLVLKGMDFESINEMADDLKPDIMIGNSKGYYITRRLGIPLVRVGFPIHDRFGGQRVQHLCYRGTQQLFDRITNALIEYKQEHSPVGYKYI